MLRMNPEDKQSRTSPTQPPPSGKAGWGADLLTFRHAYLFLLPAYLPFVLFILWPLLHGLYLSFFDVGLQKKTWIGLDNYLRLFHDEWFRYAIRNTCFFVVIVVPIVWLTSLVISLLVFPLGRLAQSFFRFAFYVPVVAGGVCLAMVWLWIFNYSYGLLNYITSSTLGVQVNWLGQMETALPSLAVVVISFINTKQRQLFITSVDTISTSRPMPRTDILRRLEKQALHGGFHSESFEPVEPSTIIRLGGP